MHHVGMQQKSNSGHGSAHFKVKYHIGEQISNYFGA